MHASSLQQLFRIYGSRGRALVVACVAIAGLVNHGYAQDSANSLLTLDNAIQIAIENNRSLKVATLEVDKSKWEVAELKTKRLPAFSGTVLGSQLLNEVSFDFPAGAFGTFPSTGPIPSNDTKITTPRRGTARPKSASP